MGLTLTSDQVASFVALQGALFSPLEFDGVEDWCVGVLRDAERLFEADRSAFLLPLTDRLVYVSESIDPKYLKPYEDRIEKVEAGVIRYLEDPLERGHARRRKLGLEVWSNAMFSRILGQPLPELPVYHEHLQPAGIVHGRAISVSLDQGETYLGLAHARPTVDPFAEEESLELLALVLPGFKAGVRTVLRLFAQRAALAEMLDALPHGLLIFDLAGRQLHRNTKLKDVLTADPERETLVHEMQRVARSVARPRLPRAKSLDMAPFPGGSAEVVTETGSYRISGSHLGRSLFGGADAVMVMLECLSPLLPSSRELQSRYALTCREAEVALLLAQGLSNAAIAGRLGISPHTVRHHAERIFGKLGVRSRKALALRFLTPSVETS